MVVDRKDRRVNPFRLGIVGLLLLVAGCVAMNALASAPGAAEIAARMRQAARAQGIQADSTTGETVARAESYRRSQAYWKLLAQAVFFAGVALVVAAGITWYQQAQQPEPPGEADEESSEPAHAGSGEEEEFA